MPCHAMPALKSRRLDGMCTGYLWFPPREAQPGGLFFRIYALRARRAIVPRSLMVCS